MMRNAPVLDPDELSDAVAHERRDGRTIAFANGCFDMIHVGHVRYIQGAAEVADILIVGVNGDDSVRQLKGEGRPLMTATERAEIIASIRGVGYVTIFDARSPAALIELLRPDFQCKGTDYTADSVPEGDVVRSYGGKVVIVGDPKDHSTTDMISRVRRSSR
jgi:D-glycero-beta-D-manno-heptose 1-phosphate adenylyltransferase